MQAANDRSAHFCLKSVTVRRRQPGCRAAGKNSSSPGPPPGSSGRWEGRNLKQAGGFGGEAGAAAGELHRLALRDGAQEDVLAKRRPPVGAKDGLGASHRGIHPRIVARPIGLEGDGFDRLSGHGILRKQVRTRQICQAGACRTEFCFCFVLPPSFRALRRARTGLFRDQRLSDGSVASCAEIQRTPAKPDCLTLVPKQVRDDGRGGRGEPSGPLLPAPALLVGDRVYGVEQGLLALGAAGA
jgi:hypothetical protein